MIDFDVIDIGTEERIIRPVGPIARVEAIFGKDKDGGIMAASLDKPEDYGFVASDSGEHGVWYEAKGDKAIRFVCRSCYIFYGFERYTDTKLKLVVAPYQLIRMMMIVAQQKGIKRASDEKTGLDFAIRFEKTQDKDNRWDYRIWTLGEKPLSPNEKRILKKDYVCLKDVCIKTPQKEIKWLLENCKPYDPAWEPNESPAQYILDFLVGE